MSDVTSSIHLNTSSPNEPSGAPSATTDVQAQSDTEEFLDGFLRVEAEVRSVPKDKITSVNLDVIGAVATAIGALRKISKLRDEMAQLRGMDITQLDKLRDYAFALARAHSAYRSAVSPSDPNGAIADELIAIRDLLVTDALALGKRKLLDLNIVDKHRSGLGYKAIAVDVDGLVALLREAAPRVAGKTAVTEEELEHAARLAQRLVTGIGIKEQDPVVLDAATLLREQAFTLFINAYDEVRRAVIYLRWHEGDADTIAPSLWAGRNKRSSNEALSPESSAPAPGTSGSSGIAPTPATSGINPSSPSGVGLPGSSPFMK